MEQTSRPAFTLVHVLWVATAGGLTFLVYSLTLHFTPLGRICISVAAFVVAVIATHLVTVLIVTAVVIPRLTPGSYWSREIDSYMASVVPGRWGKTSGAG
jgi:hypothetical protein